MIPTPEHERLRDKALRELEAAERMRLVTGKVTPEYRWRCKRAHELLEAAARMQKVSEMQPEPNSRLLVFVPEGDRTAKTVPVDLQDRWTVRLLKLLADLFGGATAYGRGVGAWKHGGTVYWDRVTVIESWVNPAAPDNARRFARVWRVLGRMCANLQQEEIGCIVDGQWKSYVPERKP